MARSSRLQYLGASDHVMARGDVSKTVFGNKDDCEVFLDRLGVGHAGSVSRMLGEIKEIKNCGKH